MTATEAKWSERIREWKESGKELHEFAAGQPYKAASLGWWAWQLRKRAGKIGQGRRGTGGRKSGPRNSEAIPLARVVPRATQDREASQMEVEVSGTRIVVKRGFDAQLLSEVVRTLREGQ